MRDLLEFVGVVAWLLSFLAAIIGCVSLGFDRRYLIPDPETRESGFRMAGATLFWTALYAGLTFAMFA